MLISLQLVTKDLKVFATVLAIAVLSCASAAHAQTAAETAAAEALGQAAMEAAGRVFTKDEIKVIRGVLGGVMADTTDQNTVSASPAVEADGANNDGHGTKGTGNKGKGNKGKGNKGKGKKDKGNKGGLPPGLAKKDSLPPGLQKQFERNGTLPPGLAKRALPSDLEQKLGPTSPGTERVIVDNDVLLIETGTRVILDVINDVLRSPG